MKKVCYFFLVTGAMLLMGLYSSGQPRLRITRIENYPDSADQGHPYNGIRTHVRNVGSDSLHGTISIFLYSTSLGITYSDTLDLNGFPIHLASGDSITLFSSTYFFKTNHYAAGDNIVVVWPYTSDLTSLPADTFYTITHYTPTVGIAEQDPSLINLFPNPVAHILSLNYPHKNEVEQVRILDLFGRIVYHANEAITSIDLSEYEEGLYVIEIVQKNGTKAIKKIVISK
jgi:hypothetical protein